MISVIIPTCHRNDLLALCLDCLAPGVQTLSFDQYEIIVTDDGTRSTAQEMVQSRYPWAKWTEGPRRGPAANRNHGAKQAQGHWLAFTDDDCLPQEDWLAVMAEATKGPALALEGAIHPLGDIDQDMADCPVNLTGGYFWSANVAVQRSLFEQIAGFDPSYQMAAHEDVDMKIRLQSLTSIVFISQAIVFHPVRTLALNMMLKSLPERCAAWAHHVNKHGQELGYRSRSNYIISQYKSHGKSFLRSLAHRRYRSSCYSLVMLFVGIPLALRHIKI